MVIWGLFEKESLGGPEIRAERLVGGRHSILGVPEHSSSEEETGPESVGNDPGHTDKMGGWIFLLQVQNFPITDRGSLLLQMPLRAYPLCSKPRKPHPRVGRLVSEYRLLSPTSAPSLYIMIIPCHGHSCLTVGAVREVLALVGDWP